MIFNLRVWCVSRFPSFLAKLRVPEDGPDEGEKGVEGQPGVRRPLKRRQGFIMLC